MCKEFQEISIIFGCFQRVAATPFLLFPSSLSTATGIWATILPTVGSSLTWPDLILGTCRALVSGAGIVLANFFPLDQCDSEF